MSALPLALTCFLLRKRFQRVKQSPDGHRVMGIGGSRKVNWWVRNFRPLNFGLSRIKRNWSDSSGNFPVKTLVSRWAWYKKNKLKKSSYQRPRCSRQQIWIHRYKICLLRFLPRKPKKFHSVSLITHIHVVRRVLMTSLESSTGQKRFVGLKN
jgi:hypothetical protein